MDEIEIERLKQTIADYRWIFFHPNDVEGTGKKVLTDILCVILGWLDNAEINDLAARVKINCAHKILRNLGILHPVNRLDIVQSLATLPVKTIVYTGVEDTKPLIGGE
jgi:hypothetical protein